MPSRREFLCKCCTGLGAAALTFERLGLVNAFAQTSDYRALVCIFLFGGNDSNNMLIPYDDYPTYAAIRNEDTGVRIPIATDPLTLLAPESAHGARFFFHPAMSGVRELFQAGKVAAVVNVGPLVEPTTRERYLNGQARRPINLFSHSDQQSLWQTSISTGFSQTGWAGRIADLDASPFPMMVTTAGLSIFTTGVSGSALSVGTTTSLNNALSLNGFDRSAAAESRFRVMTGLLRMDASAPLVGSAHETMESALDVAAVLAAAGDPPVRPFPSNGLGDQLKLVAKLIALRNVLGVSRQIFFCSIGGFDLHSAQAGTHHTLLGRLSGAMRTFYRATVDLGVDQNVTTFTLSDFARTFKANGAAGTDHAWGSHQLVMGGAVAGNNFYGTYPRLVLDRFDDADSGPGARGRWIPTTAVDQYGATLARWYGVSDDNMPAVFPNLARFAPAYLGFLPEL
jgi:uncharacterized protein (DUF1501 family)